MHFQTVGAEYPGGSAEYPGVVRRLATTDKIHRFLLLLIISV